MHMASGIFLFSFHLVENPCSVVGDNHSLMGGSADAFASRTVGLFT